MQLSKPIKFIFKAFFGLLILLIIAAFAIPYFFKDEILQRVKADINKSIDAEVDFTDVELSLFKSFPDFYFSLDNFKLTGKNEFKGVELANIEELAFSLDLMSVINNQERPVEIHELRLVKPELHVVTLKNGQSNYDISKGSSESTADSAQYSFLIQLKEYSIQDGHLIYDDHLGNMYMELVDLDHNGQGDFTQDVFDLVTKTQIQGMTFKFDGINYLKRAQGDFDITLNANIKENIFTLKENTIKVNNMTLNADGNIKPEWDKVLMDLNFSAPVNNFKNLLSLVPYAYTRDFADVKANGQFKMNGEVKGAYDLATGALPAFKLNLEIDNGSFQYPSLPLGMEAIKTILQINSPSSDLNDMVINIPQFNMKLGDNPFSANLLLKTPISDPNVDTKVNGIIELADFAQAFPMEGIKQLDGRITADVKMKAAMSSIDRQDYESVDMSGKMQIEDFDYEAEGLPLVAISDLQMQFTPKKVNVPNFTAKLGKSDLQANGHIDNVLAYFSPEKTMTGNFKMRSNYFDANQWVPAEEESSANTMVDTTSVAAKPFDRFKFELDAKVGKIDYDIYELSNTSFSGRVTPDEVRIGSFQTKIGESDFAAKGSINNVFNYLYENEILSGNIDFRSENLNLNQFMEPELDNAGQARNTANTEEELEPLVIPDNIKMNINASINQLQYTNIKLKNITGKVNVADQAVNMDNCKAKTFGGYMTIDGGYDSSNPEEPQFNLDYGIQNMQFDQAFEKLNTFQTLAPIAKYINGQFDSSLKMNGKLGKDLMPKLETINIDGFLQTIDGVINGFKPLNELSEKLNLKQLKKINLKDTKNWFNVKDGKMTVEPFDFTYQDIKMTIAGEHSINITDMNYGIQARVPRELLEKNQATAAANKGLSFLTAKANELGINIKDAEYINLAIGVTGTLQNPKFNIKPTGADGETSVKDIVSNIVEQKKEEVTAEVKNEVNEVVETAKEEVNTAVNTTVNTAKDQTKTALDSIAKNPSSTNAKEQVDKIMKDGLDNLLGGKKDTTQTEEDKTGKKTEEKLKEGVGKLKNLFGKKKKDN